MWSLKINPIFHVIIGNQIGNDNKAIDIMRVPLSINLANLTNKFIAFLMAIYGILNLIMLHFKFLYIILIVLF